MNRKLWLPALFLGATLFTSCSGTDEQEIYDDGFGASSSLNSSSVSCTGVISGGYYNGIDSCATGTTLKSALHNLIDGHADKGYDGLYETYKTSDTDHYYENDGTILDMYSEKSSGADSYNFTHGNAQCGSYSSEGNCYNREHIIPQSFFNENLPAKSDAHFIPPTDGFVNNKRSNYPFCEVDSPTWTSTNGSRLGPCATSGGDSQTSFEPIDEFKGDIARMVFYFSVRYYTEDTGWDDTTWTTGAALDSWFEALMRTWHENDPVSPRERDRNDAIYARQNNRNPFIDHPEWVNQISDF